MINIIYGAKGSGKTKKIIDKANEKAKTSKGVIMYVTDSSSHSLDIDPNIKFIEVGKYGLFDEKSLVSFVKGLLAGNYDITDIFIDGIGKFIKKDIIEMEQLYADLDRVANMANIEITSTVSAEELPEFMKKYV